MSAGIIIGFVLIGIVGLIVLAYINNQVEQKKLERARRRSNAADRLERLESLSESLPAQFLDVAFKQKLHELELHFVRQLLEVDEDDARAQGRAQELQQRLDQGDSYVVTNPKAPLHTEAQVKEARFQLESVHAQIKRAMEESVPCMLDGKRWLVFLSEQLIHAYLEHFQNVGQQALQRGEPRQARLSFERAVGLIKKQANMTPYKVRLSAFEELLEKTNAIVMEHDEAALQQSNELSQSMTGEGEEEPWKKKQMYD